MFSFNIHSSMYIDCLPRVSKKLAPANEHKASMRAPLKSIIDDYEEEEEQQQKQNYNKQNGNTSVMLLINLIQTPCGSSRCHPERSETEEVEMWLACIWSLTCPPP